VPLFLLASAAALGLLRLGFAERSEWTGRAIAEAVALAVGPMAVAYSLWERGVRRGDHRLLGLASYFVPVASLGLASVYLRVLPAGGLAAGCALIVGGAVVSGLSLARDPGGAPRS
jgi:drug/metabolite transporter (DMT)-like permease